MAPLVLHSCCLVHVCFIEQSRSGVKGRQTGCNHVELLHARHVFCFSKTISSLAFYLKATRVNVRLRVQSFEREKCEFFS